MELSPQQVVAERKIDDWLEAHRVAHLSGNRPTVPQVFRLFGFAGTGKTTILKRLRERVTWGPNLAAAYTGKAASVMTAKGVDADTIHQLIYKPAGEKGAGMIKELRAEEKQLLTAIEKSTGADEVIRSELREVRRKMRIEEENKGRPFFQLNPDSRLRGAALLSLDEISMIDNVMGEDVLSYGAPILALGDPAQLPPVRGTGFFTQCQPDVLLTEVHRQAEGSPILRLATLARVGRVFPIGAVDGGASGYAEVMRGRPDQELVMAADQILCGRNATRHNLNRRVRELLGLPADQLVVNDKIVCLRNNRDLGILNGTIWRVDEVQRSATKGTLLVWIRSDDEGISLPSPIEMHEAPFQGREVPHYEIRDAEHFDFGYAMTVHKFQGSQAGRVVLFDDWTSANRREWLYTGVTRAADHLLVVT